jgi:hypothetical protein
MKKLFTGAVLGLLALAVVPLRAQQVPQIPVKLQVVFTEYEGDKKVSSQPYTFFVNVGEQARTGVRVGVRVPANFGGKDAPTQVQYIDIGTNIDCRVFAADGGQFRTELILERSSAYSVSGSVEKGADAKNEIQAASTQPTLRTFRSNVNLMLRDGQTLQSNMATDPATGRVLKVDVTLTVVK